MAKSSKTTAGTGSPGEQLKAARKPQSSGRQLRHRVMVGGDFVFGPGKADVLAAIDETGSLAAAGRALGMSYMRIWRLCQGMQQLFKEPVIVVQRGGREKGGAVLTDAGRMALSLYRKMEAEALTATEESWRQFCKLLKPESRG